MTSSVRIQSHGQIVWLDQYGKVHRDNDKPAVIFADGELAWCKHGSYHREKGPAVIYPGGIEEYWENGVEQAYMSEGGRV